MTDKLVSIGFPTYKREEFAIAQIKSLLRQTYFNIEIIVSNNSPDKDSLDDFIIEIAPIEPRVKYYKQNKNIGPARNYLFVLEKSVGDFFLWIADDDNLANDYISRAISSFHTYESISLYTTSAILQYESYNSILKTEVSTFNLTNKIDIYKKLLFYCFGNEGPNVHFYSVYKSEVLKEFLNKNPFLNFWGGDVLFTFKLFSANRVYHDQDYFGLVYSMGGESSTIKKFASKEIISWSDVIYYIRLPLNIFKSIAINSQISFLNKVYLCVFMIKLFYSTDKGKKLKRIIVRESANRFVSYLRYKFQ